MNRGLATLVAALAMMDPDDVPPLPRRRRAYGGMNADDNDAVLRADDKRARKALRRLVEREATRSGRATARIGLAVHEYARRRSVPQSLALAMGHPWPFDVPAGEGER